MADATPFSALDEHDALVGQAPGLRVVIAVQHGAPAAGPRRQVVSGAAVDALAADEAAWTGRDVYAAGPPPMLRSLAALFVDRRVAQDRLHFDAFGT